MEQTHGNFNESPNEHDEIIVDVAAHSTVDPGWNGFWDTPVPMGGPPPFLGPVNSAPNPGIAAAFRPDDVDFRGGFVARRQNFIRETIAHECGHGIHINHYETLYNAAPADGLGPAIDVDVNPFDPTIHGEPWRPNMAGVLNVEPDVMTSNGGLISGALPPGGNVVPSTFDETSLRQIRLHIKHP